MWLYCKLLQTQEKHLSKMVQLINHLSLISWRNLCVWRNQSAVKWIETIWTFFLLNCEYLSVGSFYACLPIVRIYFLMNVCVCERVFFVFNDVFAFSLSLSFFHSLNRARLRGRIFKCECNRTKTVLHWENKWVWISCSLRIGTVCTLL